MKANPHFSEPGNSPQPLQADSSQWRMRVRIALKDIRNHFNTRDKKKVKDLPQTGFLKKTMRSSPWWFISIGIHIAALLLLAVITVAQISPTEERMVIVTISESTPQIDLSKCIPEDIYEPPSIPKNSCYQAPERPFLLYPGFLPKTKDTTIKDTYPQVKDSPADAISFLPRGNSGFRGKIPGKTGAMGVGQGGGEESGFNTSGGAKGSNDSPETNVAMDSSNPLPVYPPLARQLEQEGRVILQVEVNENGSVRSVLIIKSSGFKLLDESALETVKNWIFMPATKNSKPVSGTIKIPINFKLI